MHPKIGVLALLVILIIVFINIPAMAQDDNYEVWFEADNTFNSKYVWRGIVLNDDWVWQPSTTLGLGLFSFNVWANMDLAGEYDQKMTEVDFTLDFSWSWDNISYSIGGMYYLYPEEDIDPSMELYAIVGIDTVLLPTVSFYRDVREGDGSYTSIGISQGFPDILQPSDDISLSADIWASIGYGSENHNDFNYGVAEAALADITVGASLSTAIGENWTITGSLNYSNLPDSEIGDSQEDDSTFWGGASITLSL